MPKYLLIIALCLSISNAYAQDLWLCTGYCPCHICTGKTPKDKGYNITASGIPGNIGVIACNWLKFGTKVKIGGKVYLVQDRGAKSLFGDKKHHIKHIDIYFKTHQEALNWGKQWLEVEILD
jgi:3D (Asp-Asp-Asp) domain-containing protein